MRFLKGFSAKEWHKLCFQIIFVINGFPPMSRSTLLQIAINIQIKPWADPGAWHRWQSIFYFLAFWQQFFKFFFVSYFFSLFFLLDFYFLKYKSLVKEWIWKITRNMTSYYIYPKLDCFLKFQLNSILWMSKDCSF